MHATAFHQLGFAKYQTDSVQLENMFQAVFCIDALRCEVSLPGVTCVFPVTGQSASVAGSSWQSKCKGRGKRGLSSALLRQPQPQPSLICALFGLITGLYGSFSHSKTSFLLFFRTKIAPKNVC